MAILALESQTVRVEIDPDFGARVLSLIDRRSGRDWMAKGPRSNQAGEDAVSKLSGVKTHGGQIFVACQEIEGRIPQSA